MQWRKVSRSEDFAERKAGHKLAQAKSERGFTKHALRKHAKNFQPRVIMRGGYRL